MIDWDDFSGFVQFIEALELRNFQPWELLIAVTRKKNAPPKKRIWHNIAPTIIVLDHLRDTLNVPIVLSSVYRTPAYNRTLRGSASLSQHQAFTAADFHVRNVLPLEAGTLLKQWRNEGRRFRLPSPITRRQVNTSAGSIPFDGLDVLEDRDGWSFKFKGGIGIYSTFVHLDTRGQNRSWWGRGARPPRP